MSLFDRAWTLVPGVLYQGNPVYYSSQANDYAWEYCDNLLALPEALEAALRASRRLCR